MLFLLTTIVSCPDIFHMHELCTRITSFASQVLTVTDTWVMRSNPNLCPTHFWSYTVYSFTTRDFAFIEYHGPARFVIVDSAICQAVNECIL